MTHRTRLKSILACLIALAGAASVSHADDLPLDFESSGGQKVKFRPAAEKAEYISEKFGIVAIGIALDLSKPEKLERVWFGTDKPSGELFGMFKKVRKATRVDADGAITFVYELEFNSKLEFIMPNNGGRWKGKLSGVLSGGKAVELVASQSMEDEV